MSPKVAIIGSGLSGLACAIELKKYDVVPKVFEKLSSIGGRVKTDEVDGFLLDHGFQVFLPSYPIGPRYLDYKALGLKKFMPGAYVYKDNNFHMISDPLRRPQHILKTITFPYATLKDKFLILKLISSTAKCNHAFKNRQPTLEFLKDFGFSKNFIDAFFIPFFSGVFLTNKLQVPVDFFKFIFHCFSKANACLPTYGMQMIPQQMADQIGEEHIQLNSEAMSLSFKDLEFQMLSI